MMTMKKAVDKKAMRSILAKLYAVNSYYAHQDFKRANPKGRRYGKDGTPLPYNPYSLSPLTQEVRAVYKKAQRVIWSDDTENEIKAYLMRIRMNGELDKALEWEKATPARYKNNIYRDNCEAVEGG